MKFLICILPLLFVVIGVLNYMYFAKDIGSTIVLLSLGIIATIYNLWKQQYITIALISIVIVIGLVSLFSYLIHSGV